MKPACIAFCITFFLAVPPAVAQSDDEEVELDDDTAAPAPQGGDEVELGDDLVAPIDDGDSPGGVEENPGAPHAVGMDANKKKAGPAADARGPYPLELAARPITLNSGMSEVYLEIPTNFDPFWAAGTLRGSYGVNDKIEISLRYGLGALDQDSEFTEGKAIGVDFVYLLHKNIAVQASVPMLLDPLAFGFTLGAPMKWQPFEKLAFTFGRNLVNIKIKRFVPDVNNAVVDAGLVAQDDTNTTMPDGDIRMLFGLIYQQSPNLAIVGETGFIAPDFGTTDAGYPLTLSLVYASTNKLDLGGRIGFSNLDAATDHFGVAIFCALRL